MRPALVIALVLFIGCGRRDFSNVGDGGGDVSGDAIDDPHYQVMPGWKLDVLVDLTGIVPYVPTDFTDGTDEVLDNAPSATAALYPPFTGELAVSYGRTVVELGSDLTPTVHSYRPAVPDTTGPDAIFRMSFGAPSDTGPLLFAACASQGQGDGLFTISPSWQIARENMNNNVVGVAFDPTGAYDSVGAPTIYFIDVSGVERRESPSTMLTIYANSTNTYSGLTMTDTALFFEDLPATATLDRLFETTHALQPVTTSSNLASLEGGAPSSTSVAVIRDSATLAIYANDGTSIDLASSTDPAWTWVHGSAPQPPHRLANSYIVLESNRTLDRDRLLLISPAD